MSSFPDPDRRYTMALASIIYDVLDDYIVHASIHKFLSSERAAALEHLKVLEDMGIHTDSIIIFDRGYYSEDMFRYCVEHGYFCVLRLKECLNLSKNAAVIPSLSFQAVKRRDFRSFHTGHRSSAG